MKHRRTPAVFLWLLCSWVFTFADNQKPASPPPQMSRETRMELIHAFNAELVYIRTVFPMGRVGLTLKDGVLSPRGEQLQQMIAINGPATKPGDPARISAITFKDNRIRFEINGGPVKKQKWYQRIEVGGMGGTAPIAPGDPGANPHGSYVDLVFDKYIPDLDARQLKDLLTPVFDFKAKTAEEAYLETMTPKVKEAIKNHRVLVGMNREMVIYAKGRAPQKIREKDGDVEYEEWIYGEPPQDVDFVRFVGDEVVRVETMNVKGERVVRTEREVDVAQPAVAKEEEPAGRPANAPSLRRPGEVPDNSTPDAVTNQPQAPIAPPGPPAPPTGGGAPPD